MQIGNGLLMGGGTMFNPISGMVNSFLHPERGYEKAAEEMRKYWEQSLGFQRPFMNAGRRQIPMLMGAERSLLNPAELESQWMKGYETSPYAKKSFENAKASGLDTASSMGLGGSSTALSNIQNSSSDIMNADRQQYMNDLMQKYMQGIGIGKDMFNTGAITAINAGRQANEMGGNMAQAAYGATNAPGDLIRNLAAMISKMFTQSQTGAGGY